MIGILPVAIITVVLCYFLSFRAIPTIALKRSAFKLSLVLAFLASIASIAFFYDQVETLAVNEDIGFGGVAVVGSYVTTLAAMVAALLGLWIRAGETILPQVVRHRQQWKRMLLLLLLLAGLLSLVLAGFLIASVYH